MKVRVLWTLRGRTVVEIPDGTAEEDVFDVILDTAEDDTDWTDGDTDGYEIDDWEVVEVQP